MGDTDETDKYILNTQKILGKFIKKPPLTSKLLKKPPFRFLHDVVCVVMKEHGFLKGLFSDVELISENVKDREAKIAFLTKLIDATKAVTNKDLKARPSKIVAGLDPEDTNGLLQAIGSALEQKLDTTEYVKQQKKKGKPKIETEKLKKASKTSIKSEDRAKIMKKEPRKLIDVSPKEKSKIKKDEAKNSVRDKVIDSVRNEKKGLKEKSKNKPNRIKEKEETATKGPKKTKEDLKISNQLEIKKVTSEPIMVTNESKIELNESRTETSEMDDINTTTSESQIETKEFITEKNEPKIETNEFNSATKEFKSEINESNTGTTVPNDKVDTKSDSNETKAALERPKSARPRSGDFKKDRAPSSKLKQDVAKSETKIEHIPTRPKSSLRPPSVRPSSARPGAPRLRPDSALPGQEVVAMGKINVIIENYSDKDADDEETVVIQNASEIELENHILDLPADKGHLVEQILEQIHEDDVLEHSKPKIDIDWEQEGLRTRDSTVKEIGQLRASIQALTRSANPLGKLLNYLHEDVEAMESELKMWNWTRKQVSAEIEKQTKINVETTKPLEVQLKELVENIKKQEQEVSLARGNILRNETRILQLTERLLY